MSLTRSHLKALEFLKKTAADQNMDPGAQAMMAASKINPMSNNPTITPIDTNPPEQEGEDTSKLEEAHRKEIEKKDEELRKVRAENDRTNLLLEKQKAEADLVAQHTQHLEALKKEQEKLKSEEAQQKANLAAEEADHRARLAEQKADVMVSTSEQKAKMLMDAADQNAKSYVQMTQDAQQANQDQFASQFESLSKQQQDILKKQDELSKQKEEIANSRYGVSDFTRKSVADAVAATRNLTKLRSKLQAMPGISISEAHSPVKMAATQDDVPEDEEAHYDADDADLLYNPDGSRKSWTYDQMDAQQRGAFAADGANLKDRRVAQAFLENQWRQAMESGDETAQAIARNNFNRARENADNYQHQLEADGGDAARLQLAADKNFTAKRRGLSGWVDDNLGAAGGAGAAAGATALGALASPALGVAAAATVPLYFYDKYVNDHSSEYDRVANATALAKAQEAQDKENYGMKALRYAGDMTLGGLTQRIGDWDYANQIANNYGVNRGLMGASGDTAAVDAYNQDIQSRNLSQGWGADLAKTGYEAGMLAFGTMPMAGAAARIAGGVGKSVAGGMKAYRAGRGFTTGYRAAHMNNIAANRARAAAFARNHPMLAKANRYAGYGLTAQAAALGADLSGISTGLTGDTWSQYLQPGTSQMQDTSYNGRGGAMNGFTGNQYGYQTNAPQGYAQHMQNFAEGAPTPRLDAQYHSQYQPVYAAKPAYSATAGLGPNQGQTKAAAVTTKEAATGEYDSIGQGTAERLNKGFVDWTPQGAERMDAIKNNTLTNAVMKYSPFISQLTGGMIAPFSGAYDSVRPDWLKWMNGRGGAEAFATSLLPQGFANTGVWDKAPTRVRTTQGRALDAIYRSQHQMQDRQVNLPHRMTGSGIEDLLSQLTSYA